jgi:hypothetical protein
VAIYSYGVLIGLGTLLAIVWPVRLAGNFFGGVSLFDLGSRYKGWGGSPPGIDLQKCLTFLGVWLHAV